MSIKIRYYTLCVFCEQMCLYCLLNKATNSFKLGNSVGNNLGNVKILLEIIENKIQSTNSKS